MKLLSRYCISVALVVCCLLPMAAAQSRFYHGVELDQLGLTADQKSKIEALLKKASDDRSALMNQMPKPQFEAGSLNEDYKLAHKKYIERDRQINDDEEKQLRAILTPDQWQRLKIKMFPADQWRVSGFIFADDDLSHYSVRLDSYPPSDHLSYVIHKKDVKLSILDATGKPIPNAPQLALAPDTPDTIAPSNYQDGLSDIYAARLHLTLDRKQAQPGLYTIELTAAVDATDAQTHDSIKLRNAHAASYPRVYLTPRPDAEPALAPGQRFIGSPWSETDASADTSYLDVKTGKPIKWKYMNTRIIVLRKVEPVSGGNRLTFDLEGHLGQISLQSNATATTLPCLAPLLTEPNVRALKAGYEGKRVWTYGGAGGQCVSSDSNVSISMGGKVSLPMQIKHIERVYLPHQELAIGAATFMGGERQSAFATDNPLIVILDAPAKGLELTGFMSVNKPGAKVGDDALPKEVSNPRAYCLGLMNVFADKWDFERQYSLQSPLINGEKWPAKMRKAVLAGRVTKGMTREMVAWVMGWPNIYGTKQEMLKLSDWTYDNIPSDGVICFKNGLLSSQDWPALP